MRQRPPIIVSIAVGLEVTVLVPVILFTCASDIPRLLACSFGLGVLVLWEGWWLCANQPPMPTVCQRPPKGWHCTRSPGHSGPCAAVPVSNEYPAR